VFAFACPDALDHRSERNW